MRNEGMEYTVVAAPTMKQLIDDVNRKLERGFSCQGGISTTVVPGRVGIFPSESFSFHQAMMKKSSSTQADIEGHGSDLWPEVQE